MIFIVKEISLPKILEVYIDKSCITFLINIWTKQYLCQNKYKKDINNFIFLIINQSNGENKAKCQGHNLLILKRKPPNK